MSTAPVTLLVARRVAAGRYRDFLAWQREGEALAADFNLGAGPYLGELSLAARVLLSTLVLTPLMTYWFIPLSSRLLAPWLHRRPQRAASLPEAH